MFILISPVAAQVYGGEVQSLPAGGDIAQPQYHNHTVLFTKLSEMFQYPCLWGGSNRVHIFTKVYVIFVFINVNVFSFHL